MTPRHRPRLLLAVPAFLALTGGCVADDEAVDPELGETSSEIIMGSEDWNVLPAFETSSLYWKGAGYGRAAANLNSATGSCSGWLLSDDILVTARHCRDADGRLTATFGRYDNSFGSAALGIADARIRLTQLGVPANMAFDTAAIASNAITMFTCDRIDQEIDGRDIDYYRCAPNLLTLTVPPFNRARTFVIEPGLLYGHFEVAPGRRSDGDGLYMVTVNRPNWATGNRSVLLSPNGWIYDADDDELDWDMWPGSFELVGADGVCGSSGGVIVERSSNRAYGVFVGDYGADNGKCDRDVYGNGGTWESNVGTYLSNKATTWAASFPGPEAVPSIGTHVAPWVGGTGGTLHVGACPANYVAAGVATTLYNTMVGDLALVCVPFQKGYNLVLGDQDLERNLDEATVIAGGSIDTGYHRVTGEDFNTFIHEVTSGPDARADHELVMCPPGAYLSGVKTRVQGQVKAVRAIQCRELQSRANLSGQTWIVQNTSDVLPFIPYSSQGTNQDSLCQANSFATGLRVRAGAWTDGLQVTCTQLYPVPVVVPPGGGFPLR